MKLKKSIALLLALVLFAVFWGCGGEPAVPETTASLIADVTPLKPKPVPTTAPAATETEPPVSTTAETATPETTAPPTTVPETTAPPVTVAAEVSQGIENEAQVLAAEAAVPIGLTAAPTGEKEKKNNSAVIDYSNTGDGYVMVRYTAETSKKLKAQVAGPTTNYTYNLTPGKWAVFPLSDGNGTYKITIFKNAKDNKYSTVLSLTTQVELSDEFAPFIHSNQFVNYDEAPNTIAAAAQICGNAAPLDKVALVYHYVVEGMVYDTELAASVKSGYVPDLDAVLEKKSGICFDYAALMTGMLRSQGVPCKLVVGYAGDVYHAWINVWSEDTGWVEGIVFFDGTSWKRMDPTFASSSHGSEEIMEYIGDDSNYSVKYLY